MSDWAMLAHALLVIGRAKIFSKKRYSLLFCSLEECKKNEGPRADQYSRSPPILDCNDLEKASFIEILIELVLLAQASPGYFYVLSF